MFYFVIGKIAFKIAVFHLLSSNLRYFSLFQIFIANSMTSLCIITSRLTLLHLVIQAEQLSMLYTYLTHFGLLYTTIIRIFQKINVHRNVTLFAMKSPN